MTNQEIAKLLRNVAAAYSIKDEKKFRFQLLAYQKAADSIEHETTQLKDLYKEEKLDEIPGVGPTLKSHLEELFKTGKVKHFDWVFEGVPKAVFPLLEIPSFGPKKAYKLVKKFNLKDPETVVSDLEKIAKSGKIASLDGFGEKSQADIIRAISEFRSGFGKTTRMVLPYAYEIAEKILDYLRKPKYIQKAEVLGSLRRMKSTVGDIDIAVATINPKEAIQHFVSLPNIERVIEKGTMSASLLTSGGKQVDLITVPPEQFGSLLQHFTGSKDHNVALREYALKKGMSLSERGIKVKEKGKEVLKEYDTEEKFYNALSMDLIPAEIRENKGEIELALRQAEGAVSAQGKHLGLPKLIELKDIKGDFHIHSSYPIEPSHDLGINTMQDMVKRAIELKYEYLGFSEHNPSFSKHTKAQIVEILGKRKENIEYIKWSNKSIRIINLLETDILANGDIALDNKALEYVDAILVSIHSSFSTNKEDMTKRVLSGLSHSKAKILSHPTGRLLNQRPGYELNWDKIFDFCVKNNKALEINAWPERLDLPDTLVFQAVKYGVKMTIDTDSHAASQMDMMKYGVSVARRGWATKKDIVNSWDWTKVKDWFNI